MKSQGRSVLFIGLSAFSIVWYWLIFDPTNDVSASRVSTFLLGLVPVLIVPAVVRVGDKCKFWPIVVVSLSMLWAIRTTVHPFSPDISFHIAKVMWAARGQPLIDPVIGVTSGYPAFFHIIWGAVSFLTGLNPASLLRYVSILNLVCLWLVIWVVTKRLLDREIATVALFVASLVLFTKDTSEVLFASPGSFSMPYAILGWLLWGTATRPREFVIGAVAIGFAILLWPTHLFAALGVGIIDGIRRIRDRLAWSYVLAILIALLGIWVLRSRVLGGESWTGLQTFPRALWEFLVDRTCSVLTIGTHSYGWIPGLFGAATLAIFLFFVRSGWKCPESNKAVISLVRVSSGLFVGTICSGWFMVASAHMARLEFVALVVLVPLAAIGIKVRSSQATAVIGTRFALLSVFLAAVWLVPFLAAVAASTERLHQWQKRERRVTEFLNLNTRAGERVWAPPVTFRWVVLGKLPLHGFLAHDWPLYFGAPREEAESIARAYGQIEAADSEGTARELLREYNTGWIIADTVEWKTLGFAELFQAQSHRDTIIEGYVVDYYMSE